jgi:hypothetical protein
MKIGYVRVSKQEQNEALQIDALQDVLTQLVSCHKHIPLTVSVPSLLLSSVASQHNHSIKVEARSAYAPRVVVLQEVNWSVTVERNKPKRIRYDWAIPVQMTSFSGWDHSLVRQVVSALSAPVVRHTEVDAQRLLEVCWRKGEEQNYSDPQSLSDQRRSRETTQPAESVGEHPARSIARGSILLLASQGKSDDEIAETLEIGRATVQRDCKR